MLAGTIVFPDALFMDLSKLSLDEVTKSQLGIQESLLKGHGVLDVLAQHEHDLAQMAESISRAFEPKMMLVQDAMADFNKKYEIEARLAEMRSVAERLGDIEDYGRRITESVRSLTDVTSIYRLESLSSVLRGTGNLQDTIANSISASLNPAMAAYDEWRDALNVSVYTFELASWRQPLREHFLTSDLLGTVSSTRLDVGLESEREEVIAEVEEHFLISLPGALELLDTGLCSMWRGAWEALKSSNADRIRHSLTSARELATHVLHLLAPDNQVKGWSTNAGDFVAGRPTRKARLLYIASSVQSAGLKKYILAEIESCCALFDLLNQGAHQITPEFTDEQVKILLRKVHSMICTLIEMKSKKG